MKFSDRLISALSNAKSVCMFTGAGVSAESGVPTFRGENGLWKKFRPEELANVEAFLRNPELVWEWYSYRKNIIRGVQPNAGHYAIVEFEKRFSDFTLITQNVDNLHRRAGSRHVLELHGNIERSFCIQCGARVLDVEVNEEKKIPVCERCHGLIRPDVVWFGEYLPQEVFAQAEAAAKRCEVFFSVGTSSIVYPAAMLPFSAIDNGAYIVEVNPERTDLSSRAHEMLLGKSGVILPKLVNAISLAKGEPT
ncbi:MAG: NAD-dependent deacylase [bacterium]